MEAFVLTQLSVPEIRQLFRQELENYFSTSLPQLQQPEADALLTVQQAAEFLHLTVPTLYGKVHAREIPFSKKGKRLYFSKAELSDWVKAGRKKTQAEISEEAQDLLTRKKK